MEQKLIKNTKEEEFDKQFFKSKAKTQQENPKTKFTKAEKRALKFAEKRGDDIEEINLENL